MKLYICSTYYHAYITILKQFYNQTEADLIICDDIPTGQQLTERISKSGLFCHVWFIKQHELPDVPAKNWVDAVLCQHKRRASTLRPLLPFCVDEYEDIYIYHDGTALGSYLNDEKVSYHLIEDSLNFFQYIAQSSQKQFLYPHNLRYRIRRFLKAGYFPLGGSPYVLDIEVNERKNLQISNHNVIERPRALLEKHLSNKDIQLLYYLFGYDHPLISGTNNAIILTQPLFQDGMCLREEHRKIYEEIVAYLTNCGYDVFIKPHPRDDIDYSNFSAIVIERYFPSELFQLEKTMIFECAVTIDSSSIVKFPARNRYFWNVQKKQLQEI